MDITLIIAGMTCSGCKNSVERLLTAVNGVQKVSVDLKTGHACLTVDSGVSPQALADTVTNAGFDARIFQAED